MLLLTAYLDGIIPYALLLLLNVLCPIMALIILYDHTFPTLLAPVFSFFCIDILAEERRLDALVLQYRRSAYAESTKSAYKSQLRQYMSFCHRFQYSPLPASTTIISRYIAYISTLISPSSIPPYINVIKLLHLEYGLPDPFQANFHISSLIKGVQRQLAKPPNQK